MANITHRFATFEDITTLMNFLFTHGPNPWNHLPIPEVTAHLSGIATCDVAALIAMQGEEIIGFISYVPKAHFPHYAQHPAERQGYVAEAVVAKHMAGRGIGAQLLKAVTKILEQDGIDCIYAMRHEENIPSAGMMRKAGFMVIDTFDDPERRVSGSRRTSVCRYSTAL